MQPAGGSSFGHGEKTKINHNMAFSTVANISCICKLGALSSLWCFASVLAKWVLGNASSRNKQICQTNIKWKIQDEYMWQQLVSSCVWWTSGILLCPLCDCDRGKEIIIANELVQEAPVLSVTVPLSKFLLIVCFPHFNNSNTTTGNDWLSEFVILTNSSKVLHTHTHSLKECVSWWKANDAVCTLQLYHEDFIWHKFYRLCFESGYMYETKQDKQQSGDRVLQPIKDMHIM